MHTSPRAVLEFHDPAAVNWSPIGHVVSVAISPSTGEIMYIGADPESGSQALYALADSGGEPRALEIDLSGGVPRALAWSPDGTRIAVSTGSPTDSTDGDVFLYEVASEELTPLAIGPTNEDPSWSPDGRWLSFTEESGGTSQLWILEVDSGDEPVQYTQGPGSFFEAKWRPSP